MRHLSLRLIAAAAVLLVAAAPAGATVDPMTQQPLVAVNGSAASEPPRIPREVVAYDGTERPGTIIVDTAERWLYLVLPDGQAKRYGVGVARQGFEWRGTHRISDMREWPDWYPPEPMRRRHPELPRHVAGGPDNPLGARALYLGATLYRIHGSSEPHSIGQAMSSGCIRMLNDDVIDLYERVKIGTRVIVR